MPYFVAIVNCTHVHYKYEQTLQYTIPDLLDQTVARLLYYFMVVFTNFFLENKTICIAADGPLLSK